MPREIAAAMIGAGATILAAAVPVSWTALANRRAKHLSKRRDALLGRWEGKGSDYYVEDSQKPQITFVAVMTFTAVGHTVKADSVLRGVGGVGSVDEDKISLLGMFYNDDYLQLSYYNKNLARKQLGVVVLGLSPDGSTLRGYYSGFSPRRDTIVAGTIVLKKET
jgi:hypothetical protein